MVPVTIIVVPDDIDSELPLPIVMALLIVHVPEFHEPSNWQEFWSEMVSDVIGAIPLIALPDNEPIM